MINETLSHAHRRTVLFALSGLLALLSVVGLVGFVFAADGVSARHSSASHGLLTGFTDREAFQKVDRQQRLAAFNHTLSARGSVVRFVVEWIGVEPRRPPDAATARNPGWSGYHWGHTDAAVREATAAGLRVVLVLARSPEWNEAPGRPRGVYAGTWRPGATAYRQFAEAAARRYSGRFRDSSGQLLPRVRYWQAWNEPDLNIHLNPQWRRVHGRYVPASPGIYRGLLNAFYAGVKAVHRSNYVITAGTAPFGRNPGGPSVRPALFDRLLFCVKGRRRPRPTHCPAPVHFDILAHHPYPFGEPRQSAGNADDVNVPDLRKLTRPLRVAIRAGNVLPRRHKPLWATEISWDTGPPDPNGVPVHQEARWLEGALYTLWRQGVTSVTWYLLRDEAPVPNYGSTIQSGIYYRSHSVLADRAKPAFYTFRFPFTAYTRGRVAQIWGIAPRRGRVTIQILRRGHWSRLVGLRTHPGRVFFLAKRVSPGTALRAVQGRLRSSSWRVGPSAIKK